MPSNIFHLLFIRIPILFLLSFLLAPTGNAQVINDSLRLVWINPAEADSSRFRAINSFYINYSYAYPDSVISLTHYHYELARQKGEKPEMAKAFNNRAIAFFAQGKPDSSVLALEQTLEIISELNDSLGIARIYNNKGNIHRDRGQYHKAVESYSLGLEIFKKHNEEIYEADVLNNLGLIYEDIKKYDLALDYLNEALKLYTKLGIQNKMGNIWLNIGAVNFNLKNHDLAIAYSKKALKILKTNNNSLSIANSYRLLANIYQSLEETDTALIYSQKSLEISKKLGNELAVISNLTLIARLTFFKSVDEATRMGEEVLILAENQPNLGKEQKRDLYELLYKCYKEQKKFPQSLLMHEKYKIYHDSIQSEENHIAMIRESIQSKLELQLLQNQHNTEKFQAELQLKQLKERYILILISIGLISLILFYTRSRIVSHRRQQEALLAEIEQLKSSSKTSMAIPSTFQLDRAKIVEHIDKSINDTDWKVLNILLDDPVISNKDIAEKAFMSVDGIGSSLRRMYIAFDIKESKYKKISLIMEAIKLSNK